MAISRGSFARIALFDKKLTGKLKDFPSASRTMFFFVTYNQMGNYFH